MSIRERLRISCENVAYGADKTWYHNVSQLQKAHMEFFLREKQLEEQCNIELRPRTVRDSIPNSRLASYSNYEYNHSRELSYTSEDFGKPLIFTSQSNNEENTEPWLSKEVDFFYKYYTTSDDSKEVLNENVRASMYESPFMKTNSLQEYILKLEIGKDTVKKLWDCNCTSSNHCFPFHQPNLSSTGNFFDLNDQQSIKLNKNHPPNSSSISSGKGRGLFSNLKVKNDVEVECQMNQDRRLYSAVLQGFTNKLPSPPSANKMTVLKRNVNRSDSKSVIDKLCASNEVIRKQSQCCNSKLSENNNNMANTNSVLVRNVSVYPQILLANETNSILPNLSTNICNNSLYSHNNNRILNSSNIFQPVMQNHQSLVPRYRQGYLPNNYMYPSFYMFIQNSFQQQQHMLQSLYNPMLLQRRAFTVPTSQQQYSVSSGNIGSLLNQNHFVCKSVRRWDEPVTKRKKPESVSFKRVSRNLDDISTCGSNIKTSASSSSSDLDPEFEDLVTRTVDLVLDENNSNENVVPVSKSLSDELERQALEQYNSSTDNVFQELERQAMEEYDGCSENYRSPPNYDPLLFGGCFKLELCAVY